MTVYSFYIFDRHTECIYSKHWLPQTPPAPPASSSGDHPPASSHHHHHSTGQFQQHLQQHPHMHAMATSNNAAGGGGPGSTAPATTTTTTAAAGAATVAHRPPSADDAKLIFGAVFSLRSMVRKLGGPDDAFISYSTAEYKLHYFETASNLRFVLLTDPETQSMRSVLHQIYVSLWVEHVVKNPLAPVEHKNGEGVRSELFEQVLDRFLGTLGYV
jgi:hypothetical protein